LALTPQQALWLELMQFYIREAWLLDERKSKEWLDIFTDDVLYFMPRRKNVLRREAHDRARRQRSARQEPQRLPKE
jgi:3-phenylpropionate/cinnamic acid dioxygenase small subunit